MRVPSPPEPRPADLRPVIAQLPPADRRLPHLRFIEERTTPEDLWVHSTIFVIVDKHAQLRGVYQTGGEDVSWPDEKAKVLAAAKQLEREP